MFNLERTASALLISLAFGSSLDAQNLIDYHLTVKTGSNGTNLPVSAFLVGTKGHHADVISLGKPDAHSTKKVAIEQIPDIGVIQRITFAMKDDSIFGEDIWILSSAEVIRGSKTDVVGEEGFSEFVINKTINPGTIHHINATRIVNPKVTFTKTGDPIVNPLTVTLVYAGNNITSDNDRELMDYTTSWSHIDAIQVSSERTTSVGASATLSYTSPETVAGQFGAELSASFETAISNATSESREHVSESSYNWSYLVDARSFTFQKYHFEIPFADQVYRSSDGRESRVVRKVGAEIVPQGGDPLVLRDGNPPVSWNMIERDWLAHVENDAVRQDILNAKPTLLALGWVYEGNQPPLAISMTDVRAEAGEPGFAMVTWNASSVSNLDRFDIYQSKDGKLPTGLTKVKSVPAKSGSSYSANVRIAFAAQNDIAFFVIKAVDLFGSQSAPSPVAAVRLAKASSKPTPAPVASVDKDIGSLRDQPDTSGRSQPTTPSSDSSTSAAGRPDLVATFKKFFHKDGRVKAQVVVTNRGDAMAGPSTTQVYLSRNKKIDARKDTRLGQKPIPALRPGQSTTLTVERAVDAEKAHGMRIVALLDVTGAVAESNEQNEFRGGMKLQIDRRGSTDRASKVRDRKADDKKKKDGKKGGKKGKVGKNNRRK